MKIAILSPFPPYRGNIAQLNTRMYSELKKNNDVKAYNFTTLYPNFLFPGKTQFLTEDDPHVEIDSIRVLSSVNPFTFRKTAKLINEFNPDILIIPYWLSQLAPAFGSVIRMLNSTTKVIALVHNAIPHEKKFFDEPFAKYFFNKCDGFIVFSDFVRNDLLKLDVTGKILVADHPIYDQYPERINKEEASDLLGIDSKTKNLLFFGLIRNYKGLDLLIQAMDYLDNSYQLIIAGECYGNKEKYEELIESSSLKNNIHFFEQYIPDEKVPLFFSAADLLILPYKSATQSGVIALAYQMEQPMLTTNVGSLGTTIKEANVGVVVDEVSPEAIAQGIMSYFNNNDSDIYRSNILLQKKRLSWSSFITKMQAFLVDINKT